MQISGLLRLREGQGSRDGVRLLIRRGFLFRGNENVPMLIVVMVAQLYEYFKNH